MDSLRCEWLYVGVDLGIEETQALVRAMESRVVNVRIRDVYGSAMTLDITTLTQYSGIGKCEQVQCYESQFKLNWLIMVRFTSPLNKEKLKYLKASRHI